MLLLLLKRFLLLSLLTWVILSQELPSDPAQNKVMEDILGFENITWKTSYKQVKERLRALSTDMNNKEPIDIIVDKQNEEIKIKRMGIFYRYLFYKKAVPKFVKSNKDINLPLNEKDAENQDPPIDEEAEFFLMESSFPIIPSKSLQDKLIKKYGNPSNFTKNENQRGAIIWEKTNGFLIQWVESYKKKPYTNHLYYISKEMRDKIMTELKEFQYYNELKAVNDILP